MNIHDICRITGLTRGQIDQAISRLGVPIWQPFERGTARQFAPVDAFNFTVLAKLLECGLDHLTARDLLFALPFHRLGQDGMPIGLHGLELKGAPRTFAVFCRENGRWVCHFLEDLANSSVRIGTEPAIVLDVTVIAQRILAAA